VGWTTFSLLGLTVAWIVPGFSYLFLMTCLPAALLSCLPINRRWAQVFMCLAYAVMFAPIAYQLGLAFGLLRAEMLAVIFASLLWPWMAFFGIDDPAKADAQGTSPAPILS
jgi:hypothetical protein